MRLAENSDSLDLVLSKLADHMERVSATRRKLGAALVYPLFLLVGSGLLAVVGTVWLLRPQLEMLASQGQQLPWLTHCMLVLARALSWFPSCRGRLRPPAEPGTASPRARQLATTLRPCKLVVTKTG
ncbi:MAG: type II secretion system F family protein [Vulcanimicrobiota bacterium]